MRRQSHEVDMLHGPLAGKILVFALPLAASSVLQQLFNAADLAVVGRFASAQAMAAVGSNTSVVMLIISLFIGMSVGANVLIANLVGAGRREELSDAIHTVIAFSILIGAVLTVAGIALAKPILMAMHAPEDVLDLAVLYLRIYFLCMPAVMVYNFSAAVLRSRGDSRRPVYCMILAGTINLLLNLLFVIVFRLHVIGVAAATVISNYVGTGLIFWFLVREEGEFQVRVRELRSRFQARYLTQVVRIGLPAGLQGAVFSLSNVVIQSAVNSFGSDCVAGLTAGQNFEFLSMCVINSFAQAAVTFTSQNYGAKNAARCRRVFRLSLFMALGIDIALLSVIVLLRGSVIRLFTTDPAVIDYAMIRILRAGALHFLCATYEIPGGCMRGMNRSMVPAMISVLGTCAFRLLYVLVFLPTHRSVETLMLVYPLSWILTCAAMNAAYLIVRRRAFRETVPAQTEF